MEVNDETTEEADRETEVRHQPITKPEEDTHSSRSSYP